MLWLAASMLRNNMDAAEYKHVVLGLIFLKYISDSFEEHHAKLMVGQGEYAVANPEDPDEYKAETVFWVPADARWSHLQAHAKQPTIGKIMDDAMVAIERDNQRLKGVLPKDYARPALNKHLLGDLTDLIGTIGLGDRESRSKDILCRVYEYFLTQFASAEGKNGGQFCTPSSVVRLLVEMLAPYKDRIYDPVCGSGGIFEQSEKFVECHGGKLGDISVYGQESNATTRRLAFMNLAIRGIEADFGSEPPTPTAATSIPNFAPTTSSPTRPSTTPTGSERTTMCAGSSASRRRGMPSSPGCSTSSTTSPHRAWPTSSSTMGACSPTSPANATTAPPSAVTNRWTTTVK